MTTCCVSLFDAHVSTFADYRFNGSGIYQRLESVSWTQESSEIAVRAFVTSKIYCCNSLLCGCRRMHLKEILIICSEHCPRIITQTRKLCEHIIYLTLTGFLLAIMLFLNFFCQFSNHLITFPPSYPAIYQRHFRNFLSASQKLLEQPRKLTGTRLFQCEPLNCGTHYH